MKNTTETSIASLSILPRVIRLKDAPAYLGMDRNRFNKEVRPSLITVPIGIQGVAFDRFDLDAWFEQYKERFGKRCDSVETEQYQSAEKPKSRANCITSGKPRKSRSNPQRSEEAFAKAVASAMSKRPKKK